MADQRPNDHDHQAVTRDLPCGHCGHAAHLIQCSPTCDCRETY